MMAPTAHTRQGTDRHPFLLPVEDVARQLGTNLETGLSARQVAELQTKVPPNGLEDGGGVSWYKILIKQISNAMILVNQLSLPISMKISNISTGPSLCNGPEFWS
jgi:Na+-exporting ATPase